MTGFRITGQKGFHITFENGWTVSVQFGRGNYCQNYEHEKYDGPVPPSADAEVAAWYESNRNMLPFADGDIVQGNQSPAQVLAFMNEIAAKGAGDVGEGQ